MAPVWRGLGSFLGQDKTWWIRSCGNYVWLVRTWTILTGRRGRVYLKKAPLFRPDWKTQKNWWFLYLNLLRVPASDAFTATFIPFNSLFNWQCCLLHKKKKKKCNCVNPLFHKVSFQDDFSHSILFCIKQSSKKLNLPANQGVDFCWNTTEVILVQ